MVFLFSEGKSNQQREISEILRRNKAGVISDCEAILADAPFLLFETHSPLTIRAESGTAIFTADCERFARQSFPPTMTGVCEEGNQTALAVFKASGIPVITCGMNQRNTLTLSSICDRAVLAGLQRTLTDKNGRELFPAEYPISLCKPYNRFSVMAAAAALFLEGLHPETF